MNSKNHELENMYAYSNTVHDFIKNVEEKMFEYSTNMYAYSNTVHVHLFLMFRKNEKNVHKFQ